MPRVIHPAQDENLPTLRESLSNYTVDELKWYAEAIPGRTPLRKSEIQGKVFAALTSPQQLRAFVAVLHDQQVQALSYVVHNEAGWCDVERLLARFPGLQPPRSPRDRYSSYSVGSYYHDPYGKKIAGAFDIFFMYTHYFGLYIPLDVTALLRDIVPYPPPDTLRTTSAPPTLKPTRSLPEPDVMQVNGERTIFGDLAATLLMVQQGKATIGAATQLPTLGTVRALRQQLGDGDYLEYEEPGKELYERADEAIRPLALVMLVQAAKWAAPTTKGGSKLALTRQGQELMAAPLEPEHIKEAWQAWLGSNLLDELSRVKGIKGQQGKETNLTKPSERRDKLLPALKELPAGGWVTTGEFFRYARAGGLLPPIERTAESHLYVGRYSGYYYEDPWASQGIDYGEVVQGSYMRAFLWEYAATLGILEISYTWPEDAPPVVDEGYGSGDDYVSRYDGLLGFRLTGLGAYVLGLAETYTPPQEHAPSGPPPLIILPNLDIVVTDARRISAQDRSFLARFSAQQSQDVYHLSRDLLLDMAEAGSTLEGVKKFLKRHGVEESSYPQTVSIFFSDIEKRLNAVQEAGRVLMLEGDEHVLTELAHTKGLRDTVRLGKVGHTTILLVPEEQERAVRRQMKKLGYVPRK